MELDYVCDYEPRRAHPTDAGMDLMVTGFVPEKSDGAYLETDIGAVNTVCIPPGGRALLETGFHCNPAPGTVHDMRARSSLAKHGLILLNGVGTIDSGYTGEYLANVQNISQETARLATYVDYIVQVIVIPIIVPQMNSVPFLSDTHRGDGGFGSSDR